MHLTHHYDPANHCKHAPLLPPSHSCLLQELYRSLQYCGVAWKKNGPYNLKCRAVLQLVPSDDPEDSAGVAMGATAATNGGVAGAGGDGSGSGRLSRQMSGNGSDESMAVDESSPSSSQAAGGGALAAAASADDARMDAARVAPGVQRGARGRGGAGAAGGLQEREVKFEAQLYKMRDGEYSLDFQVGTALYCTWYCSSSTQVLLCRAS
jgi:hypothetical protein